MSDSYPYLAVAKKHNVPYKDVLDLADRLDDPGFRAEIKEGWVYDTMCAWSNERVRRRNAQIN